jgi:5,10-methenyltetrahydrofolate synthetase
MSDDGAYEFDWQAWRREVRRDRIDTREALADEDRSARNRRIDDWLREGFGALGGLCIGFCWPFRGEPDARFAVRRWRATGSDAALPVVVAPRTPLAFRQWWPGAPMEAGVYDIPYPVDTPERIPQAALVPVVGFDPEGYRLGYGGGYFDRTLAALETRPVSIGLGHELARLKTIHPQPHDIAFDYMVTEAGIAARIDGRLQNLTPEETDTHCRQLIAERGFLATE